MVVREEPGIRSTAAIAERVQREGPQAAVDAVEQTFGAIDEHEDRVGAWSLLRDRDELRQEARSRADGGGLLAGVPIAVKDIVDTAGVATGYGSALHADHVPRRDAGCVAAVKRAGAVIVGKTVSTEFAMWGPGKTYNPHGSLRSPGGSSSGSAAAVAAGMVPCAVGTQTGASIMLPAAYCGVVGYKPTYGTVGRAGVMALADSFDTVGSLATDVAGAALLVAALSGRRELARITPLPSPPRLAVLRSAHWHSEVLPYATEAADRAVDRLADAGAEVCEVAAPAGFDELPDLWATIVRFEVAHSLAHEWMTAADALSESLREVLETGLGINGDEYLRCVVRLAELRSTVTDAFGAYDAVVTPSAREEAPELAKGIGFGVLNRDWTALHVPCVSLPVGTGPAGLPLGLQLVGRLYRDERLLAVARWVEERGR